MTRTEHNVENVRIYQYRYRYSSIRQEKQESNLTYRRRISSVLGYLLNLSVRVFRDWRRCSHNFVGEGDHHHHFDQLGEQLLSGGVVGTDVFQGLTMLLQTANNITVQEKKCTSTSTVQVPVPVIAIGTLPVPVVNMR